VSRCSIPASISISSARARIFRGCRRRSGCFHRMEVWGQSEEASGHPDLDSIYRPDLYRDAAAALGLDSPIMNYKPEGQHHHPFKVAGHRGPIEVASDRLISSGSVA